MDGNGSAGFIVGVCVAALAAAFMSDKVTIAEINEAQRLCAKNGGLKQIESYVEEDGIVCVDGAMFTMNALNVRVASK